MSQDVRDALADLIYAVIGAIVGFALTATDSDWLSSLGGFAVLIAAIYGLYALYELARALTDRPSQSSSDSD